MFVVALSVTVAQQVLYYHNSNDFGRRASILAGAAFTVMNGIFESFLFFAVFDAGVALGRLAGAGPRLAFSLGFLLFCVYSGVVHAKMWEQKVLPFHLASRNPSRKRSPRAFNIAGLTLMSFCWFVLYSEFEGALSVIALHMLVDANCYFCVRFGLPWHESH